jgi:hypothetical protein
VNTSGLSEGSYTGIVQVTAPGANESVVVRLNVAGPPELTAAPDSLSFSVVGTDIPASQRLDIGLDGGAGWTSTAPAWVSVSPASASGQALTVASVSVNESALAEMDGGTYSGTITIDAGCSQVAPVTVAVSLDYVKGGSIVVNTNNADATFTISGPETYQGTGTSFQADGVTEGSYTVSFGAVAGFKTPGQVQLDVVNGQTATADGNYRDLRENNGIIVSMAAASTREANEVDFYAVDGTPAGTFPVEGAPAVSLRGKLVTTTVAGDFDGDGVDEVAVAHDSGLITGYEADGSVMAGFEFIAFPDNENVDLAAGDLNGDGQEEIIVGAGSGNKVDAAIRVFTYSSGAILDTGIYFLSSSDMEGVEVAVGDVDGDDIAEIVTASLDVQTADLRLWDVDASGGIGAWSVADIGGFSVPADRGMDLATGDFGADGTVELIVTFNGKGEAPVALYDVSGLSIGSFTVLGTEKLYVAAGDTDGNGTAEIVVCDASKRDPLVTVLAPDGTVQNEFNVFNDIDTNGARVSLGQVVAR